MPRGCSFSIKDIVVNRDLNGWARPILVSASVSPLTGTRLGSISHTDMNQPGSSPTAEPARESNKSTLSNQELTDVVQFDYFDFL
jgi:hypothetical protein